MLEEKLCFFVCFLFFCTIDAMISAVQKLKMPVNAHLPSVMQCVLLLFRKKKMLPRMVLYC